MAWRRAEKRTHWAFGELERRSKREWSALCGRQEWQREQLRALGVTDYFRTRSTFI